MEGQLNRILPFLAPLRRQSSPVPELDPRARDEEADLWLGSALKELKEQDRTLKREHEALWEWASRFEDARRRLEAEWAGMKGEGEGRERGLRVAIEEILQRVEGLEQALAGRLDVIASAEGSVGVPGVEGEAIEALRQQLVSLREGLDSHMRDNGALVRGHEDLVRRMQGVERCVVALGAVQRSGEATLADLRGQVEGVRSEVTSALASALEGWQAREEALRTYDQRLSMALHGLYRGQQGIGSVLRMQAVAIQGLGRRVDATARAHASGVAGLEKWARHAVERFQGLQRSLSELGGGLEEVRQGLRTLDDVRCRVQDLGDAHGREALATRGLVEQLEGLRGELQGLARKGEASEHDLVDLRGGLDEQRQRLGVLQKELIALGGDRLKDARELRALARQGEEHGRALEQLAEGTLVHDRRLDDLAARADEAGHERARAVEAISSIQGVVETTRQDLEARMMARDAALDVYSKRVTEQMERLEQRLEQLLRERTSDRQELSVLLAGLDAELRRVVESSHAQVNDRLNDILNDMVDRHGELEAQIRAANARQEDHGRQLALLPGSQAQMDAALRELRRAVAGLLRVEVLRLEDGGLPSVEPADAPRLRGPEPSVEARLSPGNYLAPEVADQVERLEQARAAYLALKRGLLSAETPLGAS